MKKTIQDDTANLKKKPRQTRSIAIVKAITSACRQILQEQGPEALNTNRISEVANVNIASVYRWFENKESIISETFEALLDEEVNTLASLYDQADELDNYSLEQSIELIIDTVFHFHKRFLALHALFYQHHQANFDMGDREHISGTHSWYKQAIIWLTSVLEQHGDELVTKDTASAAFFVITTIRGTTATAVRFYPEKIADDNFKEDLKRVLMYYLIGRG